MAENRSTEHGAAAQPLSQRGAMDRLLEMPLCLAHGN